MVLDREADSNLSQLLKLMGSKDERLNAWLKGRLTYTSPDNQNEMVDIMGRMIVRQIVAKVKTHRYFTIMIDESPDTANKEQAVFCLR